MQELTTYMHSVSVFKFSLVKSIFQVFIKSYMYNTASVERSFVVNVATDGKMLV